MFVQLKWRWPGRSGIFTVFFILMTAAILLVYHGTHSFDSFTKLIRFRTNLTSFLQTKVFAKESFDSRLAKVSVLGDLLTEREYIDTPEPLSYRNCAYAEGSRMRLYGNKTTFYLNDEIKVVFELFDMNGRRLTRGGDLVRVWMREKSKSANSAGYVVDFRNGSYMGVLKALWVGEPEVVAEIAGVRETVRAIYRVVHNYPARRFLGTFRSDDASEETECSPVPSHLNASRLCNLTFANSGGQWYCVTPQSKSLICHDYARVRWIYRHLPLSRTELNLATRCHKLFSQTLKIKVTSDSKLKRVHSQLACNRRPFKDTWSDSTPIGYFYNGQWNPRMCQSSVKLSVDAYHSCLSNRRLLISGDSTTRQYFFYLLGKLSLNFETTRWSDKKWYKYTISSKKEYNYTVEWAPHEQPFGAAGPPKSPYYFRSISAYMDEIPSSSRDLLWIHIYVHLSFFSPNVFRRRLRNIAQSVKRLVARAQNVKIAVKGSYSFKVMMYYSLDDYWGKVYDNIYREEFRDIRDHVLFLDFWDFTVGLENVSIHPKQDVVAQMVHYFMMYMCE